MSGNGSSNDATNSSSTDTADESRNPPDEVTFPPRLTCFFKTDKQQEEANLEGEENPSGQVQVVHLLQEAGKKSSFLLEPEESIAPFYSIEKPPNVVVVYENIHAGTSKESSFFLGGFQMVSTAKTVEIYLTDLEGKESYLTTSKGIAFNKEDKSGPWYKTICVVPGGPRPILSLRIKLLSLRPVDATTAKVQFMKLTARITETPSSHPKNVGQSLSASLGEITSSCQTSQSSETSKKKSVFFATPEPVRTESPRRQFHQPTPTVPPSTGITQSDLGAAMAGVSFMARSTEKGIEEALNEQLVRLEKSFGSLFGRMEQQLHFLQRHLIVQQQLIQENNEILEGQQKTIEEQTEQLRELVNQQDDLKVRVQSLQADMSIVRYQRFDTGGSLSGRRQNGAQQLEDQLESSLPPVMEIGTTVRSIDREEENDIVSGIVDNSMVEAREVKSVQLENTNLRNLIRQTAREIEERPVMCGPVLPQKSLSCGPISSFGDDQTLFSGMMLTDEELKYQRMSELRASREGDSPLSTFNPESGKEHIPNTCDIIKDDLEPEEEDPHVNIEVTLMDDAEGEDGANATTDGIDDEETDDGDVQPSVDHENWENPSVDDILEESETESQKYSPEEDRTIAIANMRKAVSGFRPIDEKKHNSTVLA